MVLLGVSSDTFLVYKKFMRSFGIWPLDGLKSGSLIIYLTTAFFEIAVMVSNVAEFIGECAYKINYTDFIVLPGWIFIAIMIRLTFRLNGNRIIPLIESTIDDWSSITRPTERSIMKRHDGYGTLAFLFVIAGTSICPLVIVILSFTIPNTSASMKNRQTYCAHSDSLNNSILEVETPPRLFISNMVMAHILCWVCHSCDLLFWSLSMHLCGQYQILKQRFKDFLLIDSQKDRRREFRRLVNRHSHLIDLSCKLEDSFHVILALMIFIEEVYVCTFACRLPYAIKYFDFMDLAHILMYMILALTSLFLYHCAGDYLTTCGEEVADVLLQCNWYRLSNESITNFSIVILRCRKSKTLTVLQMYQLNLSNFKYLINALYSYVSLAVSLVKY